MTMVITMKTLAAAQFKAKGLKTMDDVYRTREAVIITKKGRAVAKLVPAEQQPEDIFGCMKSEIEIVGDIVAPAIPIEDWEIDR
ncbi:MAG TPA: type II toxin-antitoxin system prevent-host-death family antitoxin [Terriglobales bacterium]|nr:type II toxin-antitoxin system prevent-host-death family antitoxin [Terriglobales bacterium]